MAEGSVCEITDIMPPCGDNYHYIPFCIHKKQCLFMLKIADSELEEMCVWEVAYDVVFPKIT